jgi:hypothetical protein
MEIHPLDAPVHSFRDFVVHLVLIVLGVLIALGAEGIVEAVHHRNLVAEANIKAEMRENQSVLEDNLPMMPGQSPSRERPLGRRRATAKLAPLILRICRHCSFSQAKVIADEP